MNGADGHGTSYGGGLEVLFRVLESYGWYVLLGSAFLYYVFSVCANRKSTHVVGQEPDLDNKLREARERQAQRLAEEARNNPAKTKKVNEKRERKKRKDKRRFAPDAPWIQGENMGGSNFRPDLRSRYKGRGGGG